MAEVKPVCTFALPRHYLTSNRSFACVAMLRHTAMTFYLVRVQRMSNSGKRRA